MIDRDLMDKLGDDATLSYREAMAHLAVLLHLWSSDKRANAPAFVGLLVATVVYMRGNGFTGEECVKMFQSAVDSVATAERKSGTKVVDWAKKSKQARN